MRIIRTGLSRHPFSIVFRWVLDWLFEWLMRWLANFKLTRGGQGAWQKFGECAAPGVGIRPDIYAFPTTNYPPTNAQINQANSCLGGQTAIKASSWDDLASLPANRRTVIQMRPKNETTIAWTNCTQVAVWGRQIAGSVDLPAVWQEPGSERPPLEELKRPPLKIERLLIPNWKQEIEPDRPPNVEEEPPQPREEKDPHKELKWGERYGRVPGTKVQITYRYRKRTRTGEKEKKFAGTPANVRSIFNWLARQKESLTEADDFLDTLFEALPKEVQKAVEKRNGRLTPDLKMRAIYDNFDKIDWTDWLKNFIKNWIEDKAVGKLIATSDKAAKGRGVTNTISSRWWLHGIR